MTNDAAMIHSCVLWSKTPKTYNEYGEVATTTDASQNTVCRFFTTNAVSGILSAQSGEHVLEVPKVMLPSSVTVDEGYLVVSTVTGFAGTYRVEHVNPVYWLFYNSIHHYECELEAIQ